MRARLRRAPPRRPTWTPSHERHRGRPRPAGAGAAARRPGRRAGSRGAGAIGLLVLVVWAVPIKSYRLPVALPFSLELYRLRADRARRRLAGRDRDRLARRLGRRARRSRSGCSPRWACSRSSRTRTRSRARGSQSQAIKSLTYFLSFLLAYLLVCSTIQSLSAAELVVRALVLGAAAIAVAAIYEARTNYDVFDHLHKWFSFFEPTRAIKESAQARDAAARARLGAAPDRARRGADDGAAARGVPRDPGAQPGSAPSSGARPACSASSAR